MTDILTPQERSALMSRIRGVDTKPELFVRRGLHALGYRFRKHVRSLPGRPDVVFFRRRVAVFVHGLLLAPARLRKDLYTEVARAVLENQVRRQRRTGQAAPGASHQRRMADLHRLGVRDRNGQRIHGPSRRLPRPAACDEGHLIAQYAGCLETAATAGVPSARYDSGVRDVQRTGWQQPRRGGGRCSDLRRHRRLAARHRSLRRQLPRGSGHHVTGRGTGSVTHP